MTTESSVAVNYNKIINAASMKADEILFKNISQLIEYRKEIAIAIIQCEDEDTHKNLRNVYRSVETSLKKILEL